MDKRLILNTDLLQITLDRLSRQLIENHSDFSNTVILGLQPRGIFVAQRIKSIIDRHLGTSVPIGSLDVTFYRDDFRRRDQPIKANTTKIPFLIESKNVVLVDDVLFTGRTVRAALDAMIAYGRPNMVELMVLIDRKYTRQLPVAPTYTGRQVNTMQTERVLVEWTEQGAKKDSIWLVEKETDK